MQNRQFRKIVRGMRKAIPYLSILLLFFTYLVSAVLHGALLSSFAAEVANGVLIAYAMGFAVQFVRGAIVFFSQSNPTYPDFGFTGEVVASIAAVIAIAELWYLGVSGGIAHAFAVSGCILMAFGWLIELFLLREVKRSTMQELFEDKEQWDNIRKFSEERRALMDFLEELEDESYTPTPPKKRLSGRSEEIEPGPGHPPTLSKPEDEVFYMPTEVRKYLYKVARNWGEQQANEAYDIAVKAITAGGTENDVLNVLEKDYPLLEENGQHDQEPIDVDLTGK